MSEQLSDVTTTIDTFTEPNAFLSETGHLVVDGRIATDQRTLNAVPTQREHG
ncbi:MAG: hypothetical protein AAGC49_12455 [Brevundimonas sp.]